MKARKSQCVVELKAQGTQLMLSATVNRFNLPSGLLLNLVNWSINKEHLFQCVQKSPWNKMSDHLWKFSDEGKPLSHRFGFLLLRKSTTLEVIRKIFMLVKIKRCWRTRTFGENECPPGNPEKNSNKSPKWWKWRYWAPLRVLPVLSLVTVPNWSYWRRFSSFDKTWANWIIMPLLNRHKPHKLH